MKYFSQIWRLLRENPVLGFVSILGTALAIGMVTLTVATKRLIPEGDFYPAFKRDRMLFYKYGISYDKSDTLATGDFSAARLSSRLARVIASITSAEYTSIHSVHNHDVSFQLEGDAEETETEGYLRNVDVYFWKIYDFHFVYGAPFTEEEAEAESKVIVLCKSMAEKYFGVSDPTGKEILIQYVPYRITGVVDDVSGYLTDIAAHAWSPYSRNSPLRGHPVMGGLEVDILAHSPADFPKIKEEVARKLQEYSTTLESEYVSPNGQPEPLRAMLARGSWGIEEPDLAHLDFIFYLTVLLILLVPGINLVALSYARMRRRLQELGVRKAFGATTRDLLLQVLRESIVYSLIGAVFGILLTTAAVYTQRNVLFLESAYDLDLAFTLPLSSLFSWKVIGIAVLFSVILNVVTMLIPAWRFIRRDIVCSLNAKR
jgi:hypothetical protein